MPKETCSAICRRRCCFEVCRTSMYTWDWLLMYRWAETERSQGTDSRPHVEHISATLGGTLHGKMIRCKP